MKKSSLNSDGSVPADNNTTVTQPSRKDLRHQCKDLIEAPNIFELLACLLAKVGLANELEAASLLYLVLTTRLFKEPVAALVRGDPSTGKSFLVKSVLRFFPTSAYYALTSMSQKALLHSTEPLSHRVLILFESAGIPGDFGDYIIRSLISDGFVNYLVTVRGRNAETKVIPGPTGFITTTSREWLVEDNETRLLAIRSNASPSQTTASMVAHATRRNKKLPSLAPWIALQQWLERGPVNVFVPFGVCLAELIKPLAPRFRRDFPTLLSLVEAHALLHQSRRRLNSSGAVVATWDDYRAVRKLMRNIFGSQLKSTGSDGVRKLVGAMAKLQKNQSTVSAPDLAKALHVNESTVSKYASDAISLGYVKNLELVTKRPSKYILDNELPENVEILPKTATLEAAYKASREVARKKGKRK